jgi:hypothetical protein
MLWQNLHAGNTLRSRQISPGVHLCLHQARMNEQDWNSLRSEDLIEFLSKPIQRSLFPLVSFISYISFLDDDDLPWKYYREHWDHILGRHEML